MNTRILIGASMNKRSSISYFMCGCFIFLGIYCFVNREYILGFTPFSNLRPQFDAPSSKIKRCQWKTKKDTPPVYWINLDRSIERKAVFEAEMLRTGFRHYRIAAVTPDRLEVIVKIKSKIRSNNQKEYAVICSHILAMQAAIKNAELSGTPYALILEDDIMFNFEIDYPQLIAVLPEGFGFFQLVTSHIQSIDHGWKEYLKDFDEYWSVRNNEMWSAQGYLIDTRIVKKFTEQVLHYDPLRNVYVLDFSPFGDLIGYCDMIRVSQNKAKDGFICITPSEMLVETFLYSSAASYLSHIPLIKSALVGLNSTTHQAHVDYYHKDAFRKIDEILIQLYSSEIPLAPYLQLPSC